MNRFFLSWDKPACRAVAERLLSLGNDLHRHLVLVPTRESGRQLREFLASISRTQAIFAPQVIPADQFLRMEEKEETASAPEELAGWLLALGDSPHRLYPRLFPRAMPEDFSSMLEMAGSLQNLRHAMANQGVSCIMAHHACAGRDERWTDMERLEEQCTQQLESWKLENRTAMKAEAPPRLLNSLRETGGNIILACAAEVPAPLRHALRHAESNGVPVQIWIHAPEEEAASFDSWGCPLPEEWSRRPIKIRDDQIKIAANPARLAEETCRIIARTAEGGTPDIALGVCDPDMNVALDAALRQYGWGLHNPEGKPFAGSGVMDLLRNLQRALEEKGTARPVYSLARSSLLCASLGIRNQQSCCAALDKIQQKYLPETEEYLLSRLKEAYPEAFPSIQAILEWRNRMAEPGTLGERLMEWFPALANAYGPETEAMVDKQIDMLSAALSKKPNAIGFAALDSKAAIPLLKKAQAAKIPVIAFDSGVDSDIPLSTATTDNVAASSLAADKMAELIGKAGEVAVVVHDQTSRTGIDRRDGFLNQMKNKYPKIKVVSVQYGQGDQLKSTEIAKTVLQANPNLKGYFGANEGSIIGVLNAAKETKRKLVIIGYDSGKQQKAAIADGSQAGAITQNPVGIGYKTVEAAVKALKGEKLEKIIDTGFYWYDKNNMNDPKISAVLYD